MNRNTNLLMGAIPQIHAQRSKIDRSKSVHTGFNVGDIIPIYTDMDILPGDTVEMDMNTLTRLATPIVPVMDNLSMDVYAFFVPHRLVYYHWPEFWGENEDAWKQQIEYATPQIECPSGGWGEGTIADYMGVPTKVAGLSDINAFAFRAYAKIYNDWFRDENLKDAAHIYTDDTKRTGVNTGNYITDLELGGLPAKAAKTADLFTKCLPSPQKGPSIKVPIGTSAPVKTSYDINSYPINDRAPLRWSRAKPDTGAYIAFDDTKHYAFDLWPYDSGISSDVNRANTEIIEMDDPTQAITGTGAYGIPVNLKADLTNATAATINELRTAFAIQKYYEAAARYGTRYIEFIRSVFGTESSDARLQRAEYLGGTRIPINMSAIVQTSATDAVTPQGNASGYSCTIDGDSLFTKSFEEHGTLLVLAVVRVAKRTYQQGLHKMWTRHIWSDYYNPFFANLGEQAILNKEIYAQGETVVDDNGEIIDNQVFGYQEAWAEYRYATDECTGPMRSNATGTLDIYHYADKYTGLPQLGDVWIDEPYANVDRTIAVTSKIATQLIADFYFKTSYTRVMPLYSMPGLIDHV